VAGLTHLIALIQDRCGHGMTHRADHLFVFNGNVFLHNRLECYASANRTMLAGVVALKKAAIARFTHKVAAIVQPYMLQ